MRQNPGIVSNPNPNYFQLTTVGLMNNGRSQICNTVRSTGNHEQGIVRGRTRWTNAHLVRESKFIIHACFWLENEHIIFKFNLKFKLNQIKVVKMSELGKISL